MQRTECSCSPRLSFFQRALRFPLKLIPTKMAVPILRGPIRGKRWIVGAGNHSYWLGHYESSKQKGFAEAIHPGGIVYDLGANVGFYSLLASVLVGAKGRVFSFEPVPYNLNILRKHLELNGITNCSVWEVAVGRSEGTANFDLGPNSQMGHLTDGTSSGAISIRMVALDGLVESGILPPPDVIKCDIEGGEFDALTGASNILAKYRPTVFLATHGAEVHQRCCELLSDLGYRLTPFDTPLLSEACELVATRM